MLLEERVQAPLSDPDYKTISTALHALVDALAEAAQHRERAVRCCRRGVRWPAGSGVERESRPAIR